MSTWKVTAALAVAMCRHAAATEGGGYSNARRDIDVLHMSVEETALSVLDGRYTIEIVTAVDPHMGAAVKKKLASTYYPEEPGVRVNEAAVRLDKAWRDVKVAPQTTETILVNIVKSKYTIEDIRDVDPAVAKAVRDMQLDMSTADEMATSAGHDSRKPEAASLRRVPVPLDIEVPHPDRSMLSYVVGGKFTIAGLAAVYPALATAVRIQILKALLAPPDASLDDLMKGSVSHVLQVADEETRCVVCLESLLDPESCVLPDAVALPCQHIFHEECVDKWMSVGNKSCPTCRSNEVRRSKRPIYVVKAGDDVLHGRGRFIVQLLFDKCRRLRDARLRCIVEAEDDEQSATFSMKELREAAEGKHQFIDKEAAASLLDERQQATAAAQAEAICSSLMQDVAPREGDAAALFTFKGNAYADCWQHDPLADDVGLFGVAVAKLAADPPTAEAAKSACARLHFRRFAVPVVTPDSAAKQKQIASFSYWFDLTTGEIKSPVPSQWTFGDVVPVTAVHLEMKEAPAAHKHHIVSVRREAPDAAADAAYVHCLGDRARTKREKLVVETPEDAAALARTVCANYESQDQINFVVDARWSSISTERSATGPRDLVLSFLRERKHTCSLRRGPRDVLHMSVDGEPVAEEVGMNVDRLGAVERFKEACRRGIEQRLIAAHKTWRVKSLWHVIVADVAPRYIYRCAWGFGVHSATYTSNAGLNYVDVVDKPADSSSGADACKKRVAISLYLPSALSELPPTRAFDAESFDVPLVVKEQPPSQGTGPNGRPDAAKLAGGLGLRLTKREVLASETGSPGAITDYNVALYRYRDLKKESWSAFIHCRGDPDWAWSTHTFPQGEKGMKAAVRLFCDRAWVTVALSLHWTHLHDGNGDGREHLGSAGLPAKANCTIVPVHCRDKPDDVCFAPRLEEPSRSISYVSAQGPVLAAKDVPPTRPLKELRVELADMCSTVFRKTFAVHLMAAAPTGQRDVAALYRLSLPARGNEFFVKCVAYPESPFIDFGADGIVVDDAVADKLATAGLSEFCNRWHSTTARDLDRKVRHEETLDKSFFDTLITPKAGVYCYATKQWVDAQKHYPCKEPGDDGLAKVGVQLKLQQDYKKPLPILITAAIGRVNAVPLEGSAVDKHLWKWVVRCFDDGRLGRQRPGSYSFKITETFDAGRNRDEKTFVSSISSDGARIDKACSFLNVRIVAHVTDVYAFPGIKADQREQVCELRTDSSHASPQERQLVFIRGQTKRVLPVVHFDVSKEYRRSLLRQLAKLCWEDVAAEIEASVSK